MQQSLDFTLNPLDGDHLHEECGVFAIFGSDDSAAHTALGLHALQHRGTEGAGIVANNNGKFGFHKAMGKVGDNFNSKEVIEKLAGTAAIGHNRYSTAGEKGVINIQPFCVELEFGGFALAHNGNLTNANALRKTLVDGGCIFQTTMDTEVIMHLTAHSRAMEVSEKLLDALSQVEGAYSIVAMDKNNIYGVRDPYGIRPLVLGKAGKAWVLASETCALDIIGAEYVRDVEAGEIVIINEKGVQSRKLPKLPGKRFCVFEYVYFARPDSTIEGQHVYSVRKAIGRELAQESHIAADIVVPVPDSGIPAAIGYAAQSGLPFEMGIIRSHYIGRTFIEPTDQVRHLGVKLKHNANTQVIKGKRIVLIDDSIVRGTTSKKIVQMLKEAGAAEVHMRIASPPTTNSCFYGVDTPERSKLMAANYSVDEMRDMIGADSLAFISIDGLYRASGEQNRDNKQPQFCDACFTGEYPIRIVDKNINSSGIVSNKISGTITSLKDDKAA
jgi:amidophosphoribosyltransferase